MNYSHQIKELLSTFLGLSLNCSPMERMVFELLKGNPLSEFQNGIVKLEKRMYVTKLEVNSLIFRFIFTEQKLEICVTSGKFDNL